MNLIWGGPRAEEINAALVRFVGERTNVTRGFGPCASLGVADGGEVVAACIFHNWQPEHGVMELSCAADSKLWLTRPVINAIFGFVFDECACQLVVLRVSERNTKMIRIARRVGFKETRIERMRGRDEAELLFTATDGDWRGHKMHDWKE